MYRNLLLSKHDCSICYLKSAIKGKEILPVEIRKWYEQSSHNRFGLLPLLKRRNTTNVLVYVMLNHIFNHGSFLNIAHSIRFHRYINMYVICRLVCISWDERVIHIYLMTKNEIARQENIACLVVAALLTLYKPSKRLCCIKRWHTIKVRLVKQFNEFSNFLVLFQRFWSYKVET